jgi:hypothetical protein
VPAPRFTAERGVKRLVRWLAESASISSVVS